MNARQRTKYQRWLSSQIPLIGGWLRTRAAKALARDSSSLSTRVLAKALCSSEDQELTAIALEALRRLDNQRHIDQVCQVWADTRHPRLTALLDQGGWVASSPVEARVLSALLVDRLKLVTGAGAEIAGPLVLTCEDADPIIAERARRTMDGIEAPVRQVVLDLLCARWAETRSTPLEEIMLHQSYVASKPLGVRVLSALKTGQRQQITGLGEEVVEALVLAGQDQDAAIAEEARLALQQLSNESARELVCRLVIERNDPLAREAALAGQYLPQDSLQRALFFFLTEQWDRYESLDFDQRMLRLAYGSADKALARRIRERLRAAGRIDFLTVVAGADYRSRAEAMSWDEAEFLVQMLVARDEWTRLWDLVFELHFDWSAHILQILAQNGWRPGSGDERATFEALVPLSDVIASQQVLEVLPPAVQRARAKIGGRINDIAFSPHRPVIAFGTGQGKVVLWDFERAERQEVVGGFAHSIGQLKFMPNDVLVCGERTNMTTAVCAIYGWHDNKLFRLGQHHGSVTAVEPLGDSQVLSTGRDRRIVVWDLRRQVREKRYGAWPRAACISPDGKKAALLYSGVTIISTSSLNHLASGLGGRGVSRCAAFFPDSETLFVGNFNGSVTVCRHDKGTLRTEPLPLLRHQGQVQGVEVLSAHSIVVSAGSKGSVHFTAWPDRNAVGTVQVAGERLTSLHISPDGAFMAVGDSNASMSLWDLRGLMLPELLTRPLACTKPIHLATVTALADNKGWPAPVQRALHFLEEALRHRFRYDIEIGQVPTIQVGEFDIEIDG